MRPCVQGAVAFLFSFFTPLVAAQTSPAKAPFSIDALLKVSRIGSPALSPDGKLVAFTVQTVDLPNNAKPLQIYVVPAAGGPPVQLTHEGMSNDRPAWSPDSKRIYFVSNRATTPDVKGESEIWVMNADGSTPVQVTTLPTGADGETISPDGKLLLFKSDVYPACAAGDAKPLVAYDSSCNQGKLDADAASKMHARVYSSLLYRHWTAYQGTRRSHLMLQSLDGAPNLRDLTPGALNVPPFSLGGPEPYAFSPDSAEVAYTANVDALPATSTNSDIFTVPVAGLTVSSTTEAKRLTSNAGADEGPSYSPDGKYLAYRTQTRSGYESDQWKLAIMDRNSGSPNTLTDSLDRWVESYTWSPDGKRIFFTVDDHGTNPLLMMPAAGGAVRTIAKGPTAIADVQFTPDNKVMIYSEQSGSKPNEIYKAVSSGGVGVPLTHLNDELLRQYQLTALESISADASDGSKVQSFIVKPPGFDPTRKYPVLMMIHGGPEGEWGESWSYRWNPQVFAASGFVVVMPNPHGSNGYGQAFTDAVNGDWGGRAYDDIMATADIVAGLSYIDKDRMVAAGGSYGGYMIDWILGHTDRFKALVSHAGVYDLRSEAGTTEELWFPKWEFQGFPWESQDVYDKWSPSMFVKNFKTPTLVMHGELDYRVPIGQGQQLFTALQEMNVPSKLVQFPDEGHWILKPQNSLFWYNTVIDWLQHYTIASDMKAQQARLTPAGRN